MRQATLEEKSAGGVIYRTKKGSGNQPASFEFLIGKHSGYHKWVLPKGLVEKGESELEAAIREVEEEVGVQAEVRGMTPLKTIEYWFYADLSQKMGQDAQGEVSARRVGKYQEEGGSQVRVHKRVLFYLMELREDLGQSGWEMEERMWVSYDKMLKMLDFETEREVVNEAWKRLSDPTPDLSASDQN